MLPGSFARLAVVMGAPQNGKHGLLPCSALPTSHVLESLHIHTHVNEEAHAKKFRVCCCLWKFGNSLDPSRVKKRGPGQVQARFNKDLGSAMPRQHKPEASKDEQKMRFAAFAGRIACSAEKQDDRAEEEWKLLRHLV